MSVLQSRKVAAYLLLPGLIPRIRSLVGSGFGYFAFLMAQIYAMVRLLPAAHPYLNADNIGKFGLRHVIGEAANHLVLSRRNIDQIIIFFVLLLGLAILAIQIFFLVYSLVFAPAIAHAYIFTTPSPETDVAFQLLDRIFGVKGMFGSSVDAEIPWPMHTALHQLLAFYSYGLMVIATIIFFYFVIVVVGETATTGTPFGQRFENVWVPIRLVLAITLLVPLANGLNGAQYVTLNAAKFGSSVATNGWLAFNNGIKNSDLFSENGSAKGQENPSGEYETLVARPNVPYIQGLIDAMSIIHSCAFYERHNKAPKEDVSKGSYLQQSLPTDKRITPYIVNIIGNKKGQSPILELTPGLTHVEALEHTNKGDIVVKFGYLDQKNAGDQTCGSIRIPAGSAGDTLGTWKDNGGADQILRAYFEIVKLMWFGYTNQSIGANNSSSFNPAHHPFYRFALAIFDEKNSTNYLDSLSCSGETCSTPPTSSWKNETYVYYYTILSAEFIEAHEKYATKAVEAKITEDVLKLGWGASGTWYNHIAEMNGTLMTNAMNVPELKNYPEIMSEVRAIKRVRDKGMTGKNMFEPSIAKSFNEDDTTDYFKNINRQYALTMDAAHKSLYDKDSSSDESENNPTYNAFEDAMRIVLGANALLDIRKEQSLTHPMAQLVTIGKGIIENTIRNMAVSTTTAFLGGFLGATNNAAAGIVNTVSSIFFTTAFIGLTVGVILFYILPFMPFIYTFFALGSWVKTIFEAMVGAPLWALAHMRIDGQGLPGDAAANGYFLIFEIFLRPILTVVGLIAAMIMLSAQVRLLNFIWDLAIVNSIGFKSAYEYSSECEKSGMICDVGTLLGFNRPTVDQFFFTLIYTAIVYIIFTGTCKLIDMIPNEILRWMSSPATPFSDMHDSAVQGLTQTVAMAGMVQGQQLAEGIRGSAAQSGGALGKMFKENPKPTPEQLQKQEDLNRM